MTTDNETCSWCTNEVRDSTLSETADGARICGDCRLEAQERSDATGFGWYL